MPINHARIAEALLTEDTADRGSFHHLASGLGVVAGSILGMNIAESGQEIRETYTETGAYGGSHISGGEIIVGGFAGAALIGAVTYMGIRQYAINFLGKATYYSIKNS